MNNFKRVLAVLLAGTMVLGASVTAFAEDPSASGAGTYEGNKMKYPTFSLTLPTISDDAANMYNYIADPNGNIAATKGARVTGFKFEGDNGVYFLTDATGKKYTDTSANYEVTNQNAQDIIVTAEMKVTTAAANVAMSKTADFSEDAVKNVPALYLALQNGAKTKVSPLESGTAASTASVSMLVKGKKDNYEPKYTASPTEGHEKYEYALKTGSLTWNKCIFNLTGALNKKVAWEQTNEKAFTFPTVTVTYKFAQVPIMTGDEANGYSYTWASNQPTGTIQSLTIDGVERPALITNNKVTYNSTAKKLTVAKEPVATFGLGTGDHTLVVKIGANAASAVEYTLNIEN